MKEESQSTNVDAFVNSIQIGSQIIKKNYALFDDIEVSGVNKIVVDTKPRQDSDHILQIEEVSIVACGRE
jgi:hypothetical protein